MKINPYILRGYDIRGVVGRDLTPEIVEHFGKAYGTYMLKKYNDVTRVVVGYDARETSVEYTEELTKGFTSVGLDVINIGMTLVGTVYWAQYYYNTRAAAMVTASHNPREFNGFKFANNFSEAMILEQLIELKDILESGNFHKSDRAGEVKHEDIHEVYFNDLIKRFNINKKYKIVIDASCSTAGAVIPKLLRKVGCEVVEENCEIDGSFPLGVADPTETIVMERLRDKVLEEKADIGFTYDSDGDRIGIVDEKGGITWNDVLVALFAIDVLKHHPGEKIMFNALCSKVVQETIAKYGGVPFMWRTGHGFLKNKNIEVKAAFIGELSGHFFFSADFYNHDDGCYSTLRLLDYLSGENKTLSEAIGALPQYISSPEIKIYCDDAKKVGLMKKISPILKKDYPNALVIDDETVSDGVRLELPNAMFIIRYSQNGPYLTIKFEAQEQVEYDKLRKYISDLLHTFSEIDWDNDIKVNVESLL